MIWNNAPSPESSNREALTRHLAAKIHAIADPSACALSSEAIDELACGVAAYLENASGTPDLGLFSHDTLILTSRALYSLGERRLASRLLLFGSGFAQPADWCVSGPDTMIVLDLEQLTLRPNDCMELVFFPSLRNALNAIAEVWDGSGGAGVLALRHLRDAVSALLPPRELRPRQGVRLAEEIVTRCHAQLEQLRQARAWSMTPSIINLDSRFRTRSRPRRALPDHAHTP